ncbi:S-formylglutathione hydrolase [Amylibacter sp.]|jgi:S-formylglutathione hydrolase|nr:S-formylglutathione hydrolase [Amylibacter sp.]MDG1947457.1 S-formylglutathione hydrolase [Amylibacter sp.]
MEILSENFCFEGTQGVYKHYSECCKCDMTFAVYIPPQAKVKSVPVLWYLSGLTCTHENAMVKSAAQGWAAENGVALIFPDTSPRGENVPNHDDYDLGQGAGFYVNATNGKWSDNFQMWDYITAELPKLIFKNFPLLENAQGITGHSMGGHGALTIAMSLPNQYQSVSAFAPIANPTMSEWGQKQFKEYLGTDKANWEKYDSTILMQKVGFHSNVLIDQGSADNFLDLLQPEALKNAMNVREQKGQFRFSDGYDHSYFFIMSFMRDHIEHHANILNNIN